MRSKYRHDRTPAHHDSSIDDRRIYGNYILLWTRRELIIVTFRHLSPSLSTCAFYRACLALSADILGRAGAQIPCSADSSLWVAGSMLPSRANVVVGIVSHGNYYLTAAVVSF